MRKIASTRWCQDGPWIPSPLHRKGQNCRYYALLPSTLSQALCSSISRVGDVTDLCDDFGSTVSRSTQRRAVAMLYWHFVVRTGCSGRKQDRTSLPHQHRADDITVLTMTQSAVGFGISGLNLPLTLSPGQKLPLTVSFNPQVSGHVDGSFVFTQRRFERHSSSLRPR